jgi:sulfur relay (sulfurtransferase) DsrC/TusE family protein
MPKKGDINKELGVYKNFCCGAETLILAGDPFPGCPNHRKLPTHRKRIDDYKRFAKFFRVPMDRCVTFLPEGVRLERREEAHLLHWNEWRHEMVQAAPQELANRKDGSEKEVIEFIRDFFDPTPKQQRLVVLIKAAALRKAEALIKACEHCNEEGAEFPFAVILDRVTGSNPKVTDYALEEPAKCPNCKREILEKTLVEPA